MAIPKDVAIEIAPVQTTTIEFAVLGTKPLICNRLSEKARHELLLPAGRKNAAERQSTLKHDPLEEYRATPYTLTEGPTLLAALSGWFKGAMMEAALDLPDAKKAQIGRLVWVEGHYLPLFGTPKLFMAMTRSANAARTPDVRTRAILPRWACKVAVTFVIPILNERSIANLIAAAGFTAGVGDWRPQKGKGTFGQYSLVSQDDPEWKDIVAKEGRKAQQAALADPEFYDTETADLFSWFNDTASKRGKLKLKAV